MISGKQKIRKLHLGYCTLCYQISRWYLFFCTIKGDLECSNLDIFENGECCNTNLWIETVNTWDNPRPVVCSYLFSLTLCFAVGNIGSLSKYLDWVCHTCSKRLWEWLNRGSFTGFLVGLNSKYDLVRVHISGKESLPSSRETLSCLKWGESSYQFTLFHFIGTISPS
jgi:hypothetical protein